MKTMLLIPLIAYLMLVMTGNNPEQNIPSGNKAQTAQTKVMQVMAEQADAANAMDLRQGSIMLASANNDFRVIMVTENLDFSFLAPDVPAEATFEDAIPESINDRGLSPEVPSEAAFDDSRDVVTFTRQAYSNLTPEVPSEATFEDEPMETEDSGINPGLIHSLAPLVPMQATFSDSL